ncbi:helix-turn-helix domain-containing protein [Natrinema thermotolerans]|uniref:Helix-turn-helix domain-containing protein n=1 Tax=Natrinema thermotolerans TaxID=121872 RepID=A0AAF0PC72_9EURY|nr:helix-turn-helix domain-containing protein [Natrinema thermotolerans]QCC59437.1 DNA-binding protein [Natrinema thermotolerans]WMT06410.1 helix-turn-helix domain-containing protein [Natrinema thermotolerans]
MRYVTYVITPLRGYFDRGAERLRELGVTFDAVRNVEQLNDGTIMTQKVLRGDRAVAERALEETGPTVVDYQLTDAGDRSILQLHYEPSDLTRELRAIHDRHAVLLDYPLEYTGPANRSLRVSEIGREDALRRLIEETRAIVDVEIERLGSYDPSAERPFTELTDRQREVLRVAVEEGYYEEPRQVTYGDIAARLDCSAGTVGQHLRRIEARLMSSLISGDAERAAETDGHPDPPATGPSR